MSKLRCFQRKLDDGIVAAWNGGAKVVMPVLSTGGGKTVIMGHRARQHDGYGLAMAHRSELVGQISIALAREGIRHDVMASKATVRTIVDGHMQSLGRSFYDPRAKWKVASVDTLIRRDARDPWFSQVTLVFIDEAHHVLAENKWGTAFGMFPNARGLFPTATPLRADGAGLGRHADGLVDALVEGPPMRWLIDQGFLTDYRIIGVTAKDLDLGAEDISPTTGDFNQHKMREKVKGNNKIVGDVVETYLSRARGKLGITFAVDVEHATSICAAFVAAGVPSAVVTAKTPEAERRQLLRRFAARDLLQLVNVDLFGEGFDLPAIECVSMARPTASYSLFAQQFGRALRLMLPDVLQAAWDTYTPEQRRLFISESEKPLALIFDHVGNVIRHFGPPDIERPWSLDRTRRSAGPTDAIPYRVCVNEMCLQPYERTYPECPFCGTHPPPPAERSLPEHVDGDLTEYTPEMLAEMFGAIRKVDGPAVYPQSATPVVRAAIAKRHHARQQSQAALRDTMKLVMPPTVDERINHRKFFHTFAIDTLGAQALGSTDADALRERILGKLTK